MLRVAFDLTIASKEMTGVGVYARELLVALRERDLEVREWLLPVSPRQKAVSRLLNGARLAAWHGVQVGDRMAREDVALYHSTTSLGPLRRHRPVVMTVHDATPLTMPIHTGIADRLFQRVFSREAARRADAVLAPTRTACDAIVESYGIPAARVRLVPLGVAPRFRLVTDADVDDVKTRYRLTHPYVLYVGAEPPRKNLHRLLRAFGTLGTRHRDLQLIFVGPPCPIDASLTTLAAALGLALRFRRLGGVPTKDLPGLYAGAACLAYVSLCEGFGLPVVEAMAAGCPVITSNTSAMPEVVGDAALLVEPMSEESIADGLRQVLDDEGLCASLRVRGRQRSAPLSWAVTAALTEQVYHDVAGR